MSDTSVTRYVVLSVLVIMASGSTAFAAPRHGALLRFEFDGQPDVTFDGDGLVEVDLPGAGSEYFTSGALARAAVAGDRYIAAGGRDVGSDSRLLLARFRSDTGALDTGWGNGGFVTHTIAGSFVARRINAIATDSSNRIVAMGVLESSTGRSSIFVARFNSNGSFDTTFGSGGSRIYNTNANSSDVAWDFVIDSNGRIVVGGWSSEASSRSLLLRLTTNGALDSSFGSGGRVLSTLPGTNWSLILDLALDINGRIVVTGGATTSGSLTVKPMTARYTVNGALDSTFNSNGLRLVSFPGRPGQSYCNTVVTDMMNNYTFGCMSRNPATQADEISIVRLLPSSSYDTTFDTDGRVVTGLGSPNGAVDAPMAILFPLNFFAPAMVVVGIQLSSNEEEANLVAIGYNPNGSLVSTWGGDGILFEQMPGYVYTVAQDALTIGDGKITVFGYVDEQP